MNIAKKFFATVALLVVGQAVQAATVTYTLIPDLAGNFRVTAKVGGGDNGGLSGYGFDLVGNVTALNHTTPTSLAAQKGAQIGPSGFGLARGAGTGANAFAAGFQDITAANSPLLYNIGIAAGSYTSQGVTTLVPPTAPSRSEWDAEFEIATGTYTGSFESINFNPTGPNATANVFTALNASTVLGVTPTFVKIPEPATLAIAGLGLVGLFVIRRKAA